MSHFFSHSARTAILIFLGLMPFGVTAAPDKGDSVPMYGQPTVARSAKLKQADEEYIKQATEAAGGNRAEAAKTVLANAEQLMGEGNANAAIALFNKAWLLDPDHYHSFWGFGRVSLTRSNIDDAATYFDKALELINDPEMKPSVLTDAGIAYSLKGARLENKSKSERARLFGRANDLFKESTTLDETFANTWLRWSQSLFREGNYAEAWAKLRKAEENGGQVPKGFIKSLSEKMPPPKDWSQ
jgi:tetratricopeptide (TPR) repeat protein